MRNPWLDIPLADYEGHMSLPSIAQADMLAAHLAELLRLHTPRSVAVIGCAGGNGFDRISPEVTQRVVGIDINPTYVEELSRRYAGRVPGLELHVGDIEEPGLAIEPVDFVYAALVLEYVRLGPALRSIRAICKPGGVLAVVLQLPAESLGKVSPSPYASLRALGQAMNLVTPQALREHAAGAGFVLMSSRQVALPSGKEFAFLAYRRRDADPAAGR